MNETSQEKRRRTRILVEMYVTVSVDAEREFKSLKTVNISLNGVLLRGGPELPIGTPCSLKIYLQQSDMSTYGIYFLVEGFVVRSSIDLMGIEFTDMTPESFVHLSNLVRVNAPNPELIENEMRLIPEFKRP